MKRRAFIAALGGAAAAWPLVARAQQAERVRRIGVLLSQAESNAEPQGLAALRATAAGSAGRKAATSASTIARRRQMRQPCRDWPRNLSRSSPISLSRKTPQPRSSVLQQTRTIPIIFVVVTDPIGSGFVASLSRPGGNVTGFIDLEGSLGGKWLQLLKEIAPDLAPRSFPVQPGNGALRRVLPAGPFKAAAASLAVEATAAAVNDASELSLGHCRSGTRGEWRPCCDAGMPSPMCIARGSPPSRYATYFPRSIPSAPAPNSGALLSDALGNDTLDNYRRAGAYADQIFKGTKPGSFPCKSRSNTS